MASRAPLASFNPQDWPRLAEILRLWESRGVVTSDVFERLSEIARSRAASLAGVMETNFVQDVYDLIGEQLTGNAGGLSSAAFRTEADKLIAKYGGGDLVYSQDAESEGISAWYAETVFRTNVQSAFAQARYAEQFSPEGIATAGYWMYDAILDDRNDTDKKCPEMICREMNGKVFNKEDEQAQKLLPPLHFNCRCSTIELDEQDVIDGGYEVENGQGPADQFANTDAWTDNKLDGLDLTP